MPRRPKALVLDTGSVVAYFEDEPSGWGVGRQYCGALGKVANCQVAVTLHWSSGGRQLPAGVALVCASEVV